MGRLGIRRSSQRTRRSVPEHLDVVEDAEELLAEVTSAQEG